MNISIKFEENHKGSIVNKWNRVNYRFFNSILDIQFPKGNARVGVTFNPKFVKTKYEKIQNFDFIYIGRAFFIHFNDLNSNRIESVAAFLKKVFEQFSDTARAKQKLISTIDNFIENGYFFEKKRQPLTFPVTVGSILQRIEFKQILYYFVFAKTNKTKLIFETLPISMSMFYFFQTISFKKSTVLIKTIDPALKFEIDISTEQVKIININSKIDLLTGLSASASKSQCHKTLQALSKQIIEGEF
jgi:hypothetical protein